MKIRIGLLADRRTVDEINETVDRTHFDLVDAHDNATSLDAVLFVPGSPQAHAALDRFSIAFQDENASGTLLAALCPAAVDPGPIFPFIPVPSIDTFYQLSKLQNRERLLNIEATLRLQTLRKFELAVGTETATIKSSRTVLFLGAPSPFFMRCVHDFREAGKKIDAVLSERTAFEALKQQKPSAFIVSLTDEFVPIELLDHIHGRPDLKDLPIVVIANPGQILPELSDRVTAIILSGSNDTQNIIQILSTLERQSTPVPLERHSHLAEITDRYSGVFNRRFAEVHLTAQLNAARKAGYDHTVALVSPFILETGAALPAEMLASFAGLTRTPLRKQDFIARLDWQNFIVSLPGTSKDQARVSMERIRNILETTSSGSKKPAMSFRFELRSPSQIQDAERFWKMLDASLAAKGKDQAAVA